MKRAALAFLISVVCSGCAMTVNVTPLTKSTFPPTDAKALQFYHRKPPGTWIEVARIEIEGRDSDDFNATRERARQEAARLGAEAVWVYGEHEESREGYVPPVTSKWTETRYAGGGSYKVEHTRTTPGSKYKYGVPVCRYIAIRRGATPPAGDAPVAAFACPKCSKKWECPTEDDVYECSCGKYMYLLSCPGCRKRFVWGEAGDTSCPDCGAKFAVALCPHCEHARTDKKYDGEHRCAFCNKTFWGMICPACRKTLMSGSPLSSVECPECGKTFDNPGVKPAAPAQAKAYLGLTLRNPPAGERRRLGLADDRGVVVSEVIEESPAERSGLRVGDVITGIEDADGDGWEGTFDDYLAWIQSRRPGTTVTITVLRDGKPAKITVVLETR